MSELRNVILIMTDQQHYKTMGCTGEKAARTPNLDRLAADGLVFTNHFVTNPVCSPSRASIMTGKYITQHGLWCNGVALPEAQQTLAQAMSEGGRQTAHFGKLHLHPIIRRTQPHPPYGFQVCEVGEGDQQLIDDDYFRWLRSEHPDTFVQYLTEMFVEGHAKAYTSKLPEEMHLSTWLTRRSIDWLKHRRDPERPFFLSLGFFDPHHAFNPCEPYAGRHLDSPVSNPVFEEGAIEKKPSHYHSHYNHCRKITRDPSRIMPIRRSVLAMMEHIDTCVGQLLETLREEGLEGETAVVFTSDHGELAGNHGLLWKGPYLLDDLMRVPLIVNVPGRSLGGCRIQGLTSGVDLMQTLCRMVDVQNDNTQSGRAFLDHDLNLFPEGERDCVLAEWESAGNSATASLRMVRTKESKMVYYNNSEEGELYDLIADPLEMNNLYNQPEAADRQRQMLEMLQQEYFRRRPPIQFHGGW